MEHGGVPLLGSDNVEQTTPIIVCRADIGKCLTLFLQLRGRENDKNYAGRFDSSNVDITHLSCSWPGGGRECGN